MQPAEPTLSSFANPVAKYIAATRPAFLSVTLVACLIGLASARFSGFPVAIDKGLLTLFFALVAHAGVNVINDYYDALNGSDAANSERLFPFTGGSRFIQNGVLSARATAWFGYGLLLAVIPAGLWLMQVSSPDLFWVGLGGLLVGWAYSAPPLKLMSRGLGELAIVAGWLLVVAGTDLVQRGSLALQPWLVGLPYALLVANILFINQFPDHKADALAGKRTLVVRLGPEEARWGYLAIATLAYGLLLFLVVKSLLPIYVAAGAFALPLSFKAARQLLAHASQPAALVPAIKLSILAANLSGLLLAAGLYFSVQSP
ncbi:prenyltransferase [Azovibrio restrictus]|uniref:prenyltransferase n=1 Tax=Azovibrio restrictus TaxID=146938 RepID=UPI0026EB6024|nr:prenyltransferase [Azovibrio restrictus]